MAEELAPEQRAILQQLLNASLAAHPPTDTSTGAPAHVRAAVGSASTQEDRLATLRRYAPDAAPYQRDNFAFTHPGSGQRTLYNPPGLDWGDVASITPEIGEGLGGMMGGALAAPAAIAGAAPTGGASLLAMPAGIGLGAAAGREAATLQAQRILGTVDSRGPGQRLLDAGTTAGLNAAAGPVADLAVRGARALFGPVARSFGRGTGATALDDFAQLGVPPSAGAVTGNRTMQVAEKGLEMTPGGVEPIRSLAERQVERLGNVARETAEGFGVPTNPGQAGATIREGARGAVSRFEARQGELYDNAFTMVGADTPAQLPAVRALGEQIEGEMARAPQARERVLRPVLDRIAALSADSQQGIPFDALRAVRTDLGNIIGGPPNAAEAPSSATMKYMRALYGALTDDMGAAARQAGPDAARAVSVADRYTRFNRTQNLPALEKVLDKGTDQQIYGMLFPASGRPDAQLLARVRRNMTRDEWNAVSATVLDRMGRPTAGQNAGEGFSAATFLTHWNQLMDAGPAARQVLFGGAQDAALAANLDRLVRVTQRLRDVERMANPSGTARNMIAGAGVLAAGQDVAQGDFTGAAGVLGLGVIAPRYAARMITSPEFVRWLAGSAPQIAAHGVPTESATRALLRIGVTDPQLREAIEAYQAAFTPTRATTSRRP